MLRKYRWEPIRPGRSSMLTRTDGFPSIFPKHGSTRKSMTTSFLHAVHIVCAKEVVMLFLVLPCFGNIDGNPSDLVNIELRPAVVTRDLCRMLIRREGEANLEASRNL